jgi:HD-GYP domain-containing protein (c-di-GMP phosphodiesterase class II)
LHGIGKRQALSAQARSEQSGRLSEQEFAVIQKHPVIGASILGSIPSIKPLLPVILHHHERFDGSGYPAGLKGEQILLWARMTAVADTYHALISDRPYRQALSPDRAMEIIGEVRGRQLCPECVDAFRSLMMDRRNEPSGQTQTEADQNPALWGMEEYPPPGLPDRPCPQTGAEKFQNF